MHVSQVFDDGSHVLLLQHLSYGNGSLHVDAAFQQTLWSVAPICSGSEVAQGNLVFFFHLCLFVAFSNVTSYIIAVYLRLLFSVFEVLVYLELTFLLQVIIVSCCVQFYGASLG